MYQLTQPAGDRHRRRLAHAETQRRAARLQGQTANLNANDNQGVTMNHTRPFRPVRRLACTLTALAGTLLVAATAAPAALAEPIPPIRGSDATLQVRTVIAGGMPGWQIAIIAAGAAVVAAAMAVILDRAQATRRHQAAPSV